MDSYSILSYRFLHLTYQGENPVKVFKIYISPEEGYTIPTLRDVLPHRVVLAEDQSDAFEKLGLKPFMRTPEYDHIRRVQRQPFLMAKIQDGIMVWLEELRIVSSRNDLREAFSSVVQLNG